jgi:hypothetical protein
MKKDLNEEVNKIKGLINKIEEGGAYILGADGPRDRRPGEKISAFSASDFSDEEDSSENQVEPEVAIAVLQSVAERVDKVAEALRNNFQPTEYWPYVKKMYSALKNVSDVEKMHTRSDVHGENINDVIGYIQSDFNVSPNQDDENI